MIKLKELLKNFPKCHVKGSSDIFINSISTNSKDISEGDLFIAKPGKTYDGKQFIQEAIKSGAKAIATDHFDPAYQEVTQIIHPDVLEIESFLAASFYQNPSHELFMVGITGTNGKTTTSYIVKQLLDILKGPCGLIGTIEYDIGVKKYKATRTTPNLITNQKLLREMVDCGCRSAVMEVTSHALDQGRVEKIDFDAAIFTNLSLDHLDYHETMEKYCDAKRQLFEQLGKETSKSMKCKAAIVNNDSSWTPSILQGYRGRVFTYGIDQDADLTASNIHLENYGTHVELLYRNQRINCHLPLVGRFNVYNCLAAMAVTLSQNFPLKDIVDIISQMASVPGRLQVINNSLGLKIFVDFAHSDDALANVLATLKEVQSGSGRLIVVFGCGGDRDRSKRAKMAEACEKYADICIVTTDNPRSEEPKQICLEILKGFTRPEIYLVEIDRRTAIQKAIKLARQDDIILIAGKGHESFQIFAHETVPFDDCQIAEDLCRELHSTRLN